MSQEQIQVELPKPWKVCSLDMEYQMSWCRIMALSFHRQNLQLLQESGVLNIPIHLLTTHNRMGKQRML